MAYKIIHTEARYSVDGKEHYKVYTHRKSVGVVSDFSKTVLVPVTNKDHATYEDALKELEELRNGKNK